MAITRRKNRNGKLTGYTVTVSIPSPAGGRGKRHTVGTYRLKADAEDAEREAQDAIRRGTFQIQPKEPAILMTVGKLLTTWLDGHRAKPNTIKQYEIAIRLHLIPELGDVSVTDLDGPTLQAIYNRWEKGEDPKGADTIRRCHIVLNQAYSQAMTWGTVIRNPCHGVRHASSQPREAHVLTKAQAKDFIAAMDLHPFRVYWNLVFYQGMRRGEALGLRWQDLDLERGIAIIQQTVTPAFSNRGQPQIGGTKTAAGVRRIRLSDETIDALRSYRGEWVAKKLRAGKDWQESGLITCTKVGGPISPNYADNQYRQLRHSAGIPKTVRLHDLRHTHASYLIAAGENPKVIQERLGHKRVSTTLDLYGHLMEDMQDTAANAMSRVIWGESEPTKVNDSDTSITP